MMDFGSELKQERLARGISLEMVSASTKISLRYLVALESNLFAELPGGIFSRGVVRGYARAVGLNEAQQVEAYLAARGDAGTQDVSDSGWMEFAQNVRGSRGGMRRRNQWVGVAGMFAGLAGLATVVWVAVAHHL